MHGSGGAERTAMFRATSVCIWVTLLEGFDIQALGVAAPHLVPDLHLSPGEVGNVFAGGNVGLALGSLAVGWLIDRAGLKRMLLFSIVVFSIFTFATAYVTDFGELLAVRFLAGLGFGGAFPSLIALSEVVGRGNRSIMAATLMFCGMPLGGDPPPSSYSSCRSAGNGGRCSRSAAFCRSSFVFSFGSYCRHSRYLGGPKHPDPDCGSRCLEKAACCRRCSSGRRFSRRC